MYETRDNRSIPKAGSDGYFHQCCPGGRKPRSDCGKAHKHSAAKVEWAECCEHCPYPDCWKGSVDVCLTGITYAEFLWFSEICRDVILRADDAMGALIRERIGCGMSGLYNFADRIRYPNRKQQAKIKIFLEEWENDNE